MKKNSSYVSKSYGRSGVFVIAMLMVLVASAFGIGWISLGAVAGTQEPMETGDPGPDPTGQPGSGWIPDDLVSHSLGVNSWNTDIATGPGGVLHAVWQGDVTVGGWNIFYSFSTDDGITWSNQRGVAGSPDDEQRPSISVMPDDGRIFVAYERWVAVGDAEVYVAYSDDGITWTNVVVEAFPAASPQVHPSVYVEHQIGAPNYYVYVTFGYEVDINNQNVYVYRSTDLGVSWSRMLDIGGMNANVYRAPDITLQRGTDFNDYLFLVYCEGVDFADTQNIMIDWSLDWGTSWNGPYTVAAEASTVDSPSIAASRDGDSIIVAWQRNTAGDTDIRYRSDNDPTSPGLGWSGIGTRFPTANNNAPDLAPEIVADGEGTMDLTVGGNYHMIWTAGNPLYTVNYSARPTTMIGGFTASVDVTDLNGDPSGAQPMKGLTTQLRDTGWFPGLVYSSFRVAPYDVYYVTPGSRVTVDTNPGLLDIRVDTILLTAPQNFIWPAGRTHELAAVTPQAVGPGTRYVYASWSDLGTQTHNVDSTGIDMTYTCFYTLQHQVTIATSPVNLDVNVDTIVGLAPRIFWWDDGSVHDLIAISPQITLPGVRYAYNSWSDGMAQTHSVTIVGPDTITANYDRQYYIEVYGWDTTNLMPLNGIVVSGGPPGTTPYGDWFNDGQLYNIGVEDPYNDGFNDFSFVDWNTGSNQNPLPYTPTMPDTLTANYVQAPSTYFSLTVNPFSDTVPSGGTAAYTVTVESHNAYTGNVDLSTAGLPFGAVPTFTPTPVSPPADGTVNSALAITTVGVPDGTYPFTIIGDDGAFTNNTAAELVIATPYFTIDVIPTTRLIAPGETTTYTVNVSSFVGYSREVDLNVTGVPAPATGIFAPDKVTPPADGYIWSTLTIDNTATVADGLYPLTITGDDYTLPQEVFFVDLDVQTVPLFSIGANPTWNQVSPGGSADYVITFTSFNTYWGNVSVSVEHTIPSTQATFSFVSPVEVPPPSNSTTVTITTTASIPDGEYTITVYGEDPLLPLNRRNKSVQITLNVSSLVPGTISGTVTDQNNDIVEDADVELQDDQGNTVDTTQTDNNGDYFFTAVDPGDYTVIATKTGYKSDQGDVTLGSGGDETQDLQIEQGIIRGKVVDDDGKPIEDATVELRDDNGDPVGETTTDANGNFRFDDLPLGTYTVIIKASGYDTLTEDGVVVDEADNDNNLGSLDVTPKEAAGNFLADYWWLLLLIIIIVVVIILVALLAKRKKPEPEPAPEYATAQVPAEQAPPYEAPQEQPPYEAPPEEQYPQEPQPEPQPETYPEEPQPEPQPETPPGEPYPEE
jgi:protocatechuate 3,4-dioxygenase beta subunit